jgi:hypothetical protein
MGIFGLGKKKEKEFETVSNEETILKKRILTILKKKGTKVIVLAPLSSRFIITNKLININFLVDGDAELIKMSGNSGFINKSFDVKSKSTIHKLRGEFIDQIIKVILVWIEKDREKLEKLLFDETSILEYVGELIDGLPDVEDTEVKKSLK